MSPKKVWGVILIVLGVLAVLRGASNYHDLGCPNPQMMTQPL